MKDVFKKKHSSYSCLLLTVAIISALSGCEAENPICSENYCLTGEIFHRDALGKRKFKELPANVSEQDIIDLWTVEDAKDFKPVTVSGKFDWDVRGTDWEYEEDGTVYLKKVVLEFEKDTGRHGENRVILVRLNKHTVRRSKGVSYVDWKGLGKVRLTAHIGIATYRGNIIGAPTK